MKLTHIVSAATLIEHRNTSILMDPWLVGDEFYGSWTHYPRLEVHPTHFNHVDYIYISHIHPDHLSQATLALMDPKIPCLIHSYDSKFLKNNLERWGRKVIELKHGEKFHCGDGLNISIYAADNCNPELCYKFFGCGKMETNLGSTGIDTMAVIGNGTQTILNVNDCPYQLSLTTLDLVMKRYRLIDLLLVGYAGAGSYPQCWENYTNQEKLNMYGPIKKKYFLDNGKNFLKRIKPKRFMPFAGTYTLRGKYAVLERFKVVPELQEALAEFNKVEPGGLILNSMESYNLGNDQCSNPYIPLNYEEKIQYCENTLVHEKYDYEYDKEPTLEQILSLLPNAYTNYDNKRQQLRFSSDSHVYIFLPEAKLCRISTNGNGYQIVDGIQDEKRLTYRMDFKLLHRILKGPRFAHWNNAEIGSHIAFTRNPEVYERPIYFSMNYFHI